MQKTTDKFSPFGMEHVKLTVCGALISKSDRPTDNVGASDMTIVGTWVVSFALRESENDSTVPKPDLVNVRICATADDRKSQVPESFVIAVSVMAVSFA